MKKLSEEFSRNYRRLSSQDFEREKKIKEFQNVELDRIVSDEWKSLQSKLRELGSEFYKSEQNLEKDLELLIIDLSNNCKRLRVPKPNLQSFTLPQHSDNNLLSSATDRQKYSKIGVAMAVSMASALGFWLFSTEYANFNSNPLLAGYSP